MLEKSFLIRIIAIFSAAFLIIGIFTGWLIFSDKNELTKKFVEIEKIVNDNFDGKIDDKNIDSAVFSAYINSLNDDYSEYLSAEETEEFNNTYNGNGDGIGINIVETEKNEMQVVFVHENSPASKAGILKGDIILSCDNKVCKEVGYKELYVYITGKKDGDTLKLCIFRDNKTINVDVIFGEFVSQSVIYEKIDNLGYIRITHFENSTVEQFNQAIDRLTYENVKGFIFDVRDNRGGIVQAVCKILDRLLPSCDIISVKFKNGNEKVLYTSDSSYVNIPSVVLINENSASASELFAAALREKRAAKLVGKKTFGKGVMQTTFSLKDGSSIKLTVGKFYSPNKNNWHKTGILPDLEDEQPSKTASYYLSPINDDASFIAAKNLFN